MVSAYSRQVIEKVTTTVAIGGGICKITAFQPELGLMRFSASVLILMVAGAGATVWGGDGETRLHGSPDWDRQAAAQYLDDRINLWFERASELTTGDGKTSCISCHTVVPYQLVLLCEVSATLKSSNFLPQQ
jgi:hypothetical protein